MEILKPYHETCIQQQSLEASKETKSLKSLMKLGQINSLTSGP